MNLTDFAVFSAGLLAVTLAAVPCRGAQATTQVEELVKASHIIFVGRVDQLHAANLRVVTPTDNTILVTVEEPLDVPPSVAELKGEQVTVRVARTAELRPGDSKVFFTNGLVFGEHLEVGEVGHMASPDNRSEMRRQILAVRAQTAEENLRERAAGALLVVAGKVLAVNPIARTGVRSEHEADWAQAVVQVDSVEKGALREKTVSVDFPQSTDERWLLSPKFEPGEAGIWLLRHQANLGLPPDAWLALAPLDFQPSTQQRTMRRLLAK